MLKNKNEMEIWLNTYKIKNYVINEDLTVDVNGDVYLCWEKLDEIPIQFGLVQGNFICHRNNLKSLKGSPKKVGGHFNCAWNRLSSLEGCPVEVGGIFNCSNNLLTSLNGSPENIKEVFDCSNNKLFSLDGGPEEAEQFVCSNNLLTSLEGCPKRVLYDFFCDGNKLTSLKGIHNKVIYGIFNCSYNKLTTLEYAPKIIHSEFECNNNELTNFSCFPEEAGGLSFSGNFITEPELAFFTTRVTGEINSDFTNNKSLFWCKVLCQKDNLKKTAPNEFKKKQKKRKRK